MKLRMASLLVLTLACGKDKPAPLPQKAYSPYALRSAQDSAWQKGYEHGYLVGQGIGWTLGYSAHFCMK